MRISYLLPPVLAAVMGLATAAPAASAGVTAAHLAVPTPDGLIEQVGHYHRSYDDDDCERPYRKYYGKKRYHSHYYRPAKRYRKYYDDYENYDSGYSSYYYRRRYRTCYDCGY
jgi:hypothetical protein